MSRSPQDCKVPKFPLLTSLIFEGTKLNGIIATQEMSQDLYLYLQGQAFKRKLSCKGMSSGSTIDGLEWLTLIHDERMLGVQPRVSER